MDVSFQTRINSLMINRISPEVNKETFQKVHYR